MERSRGALRILCAQETRRGPRGVSGPVGGAGHRRPSAPREIAARLLTQQVVIARRTVAKYRAEEHIPSATQRKRFF